MNDGGVGRQMGDGDNSTSDGDLGGPMGVLIMGLGPSEADRPRLRSPCHRRILAAVGLLNPDDPARGELLMMLTRHQSPIRYLHPMMNFILRL